MSSERAIGRRIPPHSDDAERAVLGACLRFGDVVEAVAPILVGEESFHHGRHRTIWRAIETLRRTGTAPDELTLYAELERMKAVGGGLAEIPLVYITELTTTPVTPETAKRHAATVREHWMRRESIRLHEEAIAAAYDLATDPFEHAERLQADLFRMTERAGSSSAHQFSSLIPDTVTAIAAQQDRGEAMLGMASGLWSIDRRLNGWQAQKQYIIAGRPAMGKSSYGLTIGVGLARENHPGLIISLEMSARSLAMRALAHAARVDSGTLQRATLSREEWRQVHDGADRVARLPITVEDGSSLSGPQIAAMVRRYRRTHRIEWFVLDYLSLAHFPGYETSRTREIGELAKLARQVGRDTNTCSIVLAQLNRAVESRGDKRPLLSDLRDSGEVEQHADVVQFVHRPEYYGIPQDEAGNPTEGMAEIITAKWRDGGVGIDRLAFIAEQVAFENMEFRRDDAPATLAAHNRPNYNRDPDEDDYPF